MFSYLDIDCSSADDNSDKYLQVGVAVVHNNGRLYRVLDAALAALRGVVCAGGNIRRTSAKLSRQPVHLQRRQRPVP